MASDEYGNQWYQPVAGVGNVGSYQISGIPFATGSLSVSNSTVTEIKFPGVTKFVTVKNNTANDLRIGFSKNGIEGTNYFIVGNKETFSADVRVTKLFLRGDSSSTTAYVLAGVTGVSASQLSNSWSGSSGVG